jgi:hypothetical protein
MLFSKNKNDNRKSKDDTYTVDFTQEDSDSVAQWGNPTWSSEPVEKLGRFLLSQMHNEPFDSAHRKSRFCRRN